MQRQSACTHHRDPVLRLWWQQVSVPSAWAGTSGHKPQIYATSRLQGDQACDQRGKIGVKEGAKVQLGSQAMLRRALWARQAGATIGKPVSGQGWGRSVGAINSQLPSDWRTDNQPKPHTNSIHSHKLDTYIGGNDSLLRSESLWLTGVPTLLGFLELMAGSFTCVKKCKSMT